VKKKLNTSLALLFLIMLVAFIIRATCNRLEYMSEGVPAYSGFEVSQIAAAVATGHGFSDPYPLVQTGPTVQQPPVYIYLLAGIYKVFGVQGNSWYLVATTLNGLFSTLVCLPIFFLGRRVSGDSLGLAAAGLWAVLPSAVVLTTGPIGVGDTAFRTLLAALLLLATIRLCGSDRTSAWIAYGLLCAFELDLNPTILSVLPFLFAWLGWHLYQRRRTWLRLPAIAGLMIVLGCAPWAIRNWVTFHHFIPFRSNFGLELWLGNNQYDDHDLVPDSRGPYDSWTETRHLAQVGEVAFMREKQLQATHFMETHRWETLRSFYLRFSVIWTGLAVRVSAIWPLLSWPGRIWLIVNFLFGILAWAGLWVMFRQRNPLAWPFFSFLVFYPAVYYLTHAALRYRHPIDPALAVLSTFAVFCVARALARQFSGAAERPASATVAQTATASD
jgi:4-amino-4-deoxy-L-arabinose transferase-like glycosyltransferase